MPTYSLFLVPFLVGVFTPPNNNTRTQNSALILINRDQKLSIVKSYSVIIWARVLLKRTVVGD